MRSALWAALASPVIVSDAIRIQNECKMLGWAALACPVAASYTILLQN